MATEPAWGRNRARAPYGLVRLPGAPMRASALHSGLPEGVDTAALLRSHDRALPGTRTGWIDVSLHTLSPLFLGQAPDGAVSRSLRLAGRPAVPGSTLRGLLRNTLRMLTGGEVGPVNTPRLFFRAPVRPNPAGAGPDRRARVVAGDRHAEYRDRLGGRVRQGFLLHHDGRWYVKEVPPGGTVPRDAGTALRISFENLRAGLERWSFGPGLGAFPDPPADSSYGPRTFGPHRPWQYREVFAVVLREHGRARRRAPAAVRAAPGEQEAREYLRECGTPGEVVRCVLVLTGAAGARRTSAYLFPVPDGLAPDRSGASGGFSARGCFPVPEELVRLVESADQLTGYQVDNFPDEVSMVGGGAGRPRPGALPRRSPEPVWFTVEAGRRGDGPRRVTSFGRAGGYRVAVGGDNPVRRAVPRELWSPQHRGGDRDGRRGRPVDVPRALFGDLDVFDGDMPAARGRVRVGHALCDEDRADLPGGPRRVRLLSPQRGCFANYLLQPDPGRYGERPDLVAWTHEGDARLGGYKVFLHRYRDGRGLELAAAEGAPEETHRDIVPLREGLRFTGRITFVNLTDAEVGALLRALLLDNPVDGGDARDPEHAHKIGMGKSLGLGSVHLAPRLYLVDRRARAASPDADAGVARAGAGQVRGFLAAFDAALAGTRLGEADPDRWREVDQARDVLLASRWRRRLPWEWTEPMEVAEFAAFPVLPGLVERFERFDAWSSGRG